MKPEENNRRGSQDWHQGFADAYDALSQTMENIAHHWKQEYKYAYNDWKQADATLASLEWDALTDESEDQESAFSRCGAERDEALIERAKAEQRMQDADRIVRDLTELRYDYYRPDVYPFSVK